MQRFIDVLTSGPIYLSSTARLFSSKRIVVDAIGHRLVLQIALAALIADRAIERMVDQQELHHAFARAFLTIGRVGQHFRRLAVRARTQSRTAQAQDATGFGAPFTSTRHMRQLPAIDSRSWKQKRGISAPASSHACSSV